MSNQFYSWNLIIHDDVERAITTCVPCSRISQQKKPITRRCISFLLIASSPRSAVAYGLAAWEAGQRCHRRFPHYPYNFLRSQPLLSPSLRQPFKNFSNRMQRQNCPLSFSCIYMPFTLYAQSLLTMRTCCNEFSQSTRKQVYVIVVIKLLIFIIMDAWIYALPG